MHTTEYYYIKKNGIMSFAGKWIELKIIMLRGKNRLRKTNITCSLSYAKSR
jgi:hypothetical protein